MAHSDNTVIQLNFKVGEVLVNLYASTATELDQALGAIEERLTRIGALNKVTAAVGAFSNAGMLAPPAQQQPQQQHVAPVDPWAQATPPRPQQQAAAPVPQCAHGNREWKTGTSGAGKEYAMWVCTQPQGSTQCSAVYPSTAGWPVGHPKAGH